MSFSHETPNIASTIGHFLTTDVSEAIHLLHASGSESLGEGIAMCKQQVAARKHLESNPVVALGMIFKAYPNETRELLLWSLNLKEIKPDAPVMYFFARNGLLNERATRPHEFIYNALGVDEPEIRKSKRSDRQKALADMQMAMIEP